ncbi:hypothetical protein [Sorangium sp. So ce1151]|uniref:hypothetical protein n=1 Tax=Sorangium sp. So ce1151 TaxID=3133332 RepID=UPI003F63FEB4
MKTTTLEPHGPVARRAGASSGRAPVAARDRRITGAARGSSRPASARAAVAPLGPWDPPAAGRGGAA